MPRFFRNAKVPMGAENSYVTGCAFTGLMLQLCSMIALVSDGRVDRLRRRAENGILVGTMGRRLLPSQSFGPGWLLWVWLGLLGPGCGWAQQTSPANDAPITTLHVYTNLAQIPTLVLTKRHEEMPPVPPAQFRLSLDSGPAVPPTHVRVEATTRSRWRS
jgi:hypothetical protein